MYKKSDYTKFKNHINDLYSPKVIGKYYFPLVVESKNNPWYLSCFCKINLKNIKNIPNIEICLQDFEYGYCELLAMLAHEVGHYISWKNNEATHDDLNDRCHAGKKLSRKERSLILAEERRAWKYGFQLLEDNGFDICEEMMLYKKSCLNNYYRVTKKALKT